jgi:hypothetical protein
MLGEALAAVAHERVAQDGEVAEQVGGAGVGRRVAGGAEQRGRSIVRGAAEAHHDAGDEQADGLVGKRFSRRLSGGAELAEVAVEPRGELGRDGTCCGDWRAGRRGSAGGGGSGEEQRARHGEGLARWWRG